MKVQNKIIVVTGGGNGIGRATARMFAEAGYAVAVWDLAEQAAQDTVSAITAAGGVAVAYRVDVSKPEDCVAAAKDVVARFGRVDALINNAGIVRGNGYFWENSTDDIQKVIAINSTGMMLVAHEFLPGMVAHDGDCRVVTIASSAGLVSTPRLAVYCGSKWAATGWSDSVRLELEQAGHDHIKVTTVCPTYINTGMFDGARGILFTPTLEQEDVVDETWTHMLKGEPFVVMPWTSRLNKALYGLLPIGVRDFYMEKAGVYHSMDEFTGHED